MNLSRISLPDVGRLLAFLSMAFRFSRRMQERPIVPGDKLSFHWRPGYRGPLRDGETVTVLAIAGEGVRLRYRLNREETVRPDHLLR